MAGARKKPVQVYLREDQVKALRIVAEALDKLLNELPPEEDPLLDILGLYDSGRGDLAEKHDEYLASMIKEESLGES